MFNRVIVVIMDGDSPEFDFPILGPEGMNGEDAAKLTDQLMHEVQIADPEEYGYEDLEPKLLAAGFLCPHVVTTTEKW